MARRFAVLYQKGFEKMTIGTTHYAYGPKGMLPGTARNTKIGVMFGKIMWICM